jgi:hypothetical protein
MNKKQIFRFIRKVNYGVPIEVEYFSNKRVSSRCAQVTFTRKLNKDGSIYVWSFIGVNRAQKKYLKDITLKGALLHEVGHLYTGFIIKNNKMILQPNYMREYEAQVWAIKRSKSMKMYQVKRRLIKAFKEWQFFKWNSPQQIYKKAWKIALKNCIIK